MKIINRVITAILCTALIFSLFGCALFSTKTDPDGFPGPRSYKTERYFVSDGKLTETVGESRVPGLAITAEGFRPRDRVLSVRVKNNNIIPVSFGGNYRLYQVTENNNVRLFSDMDFTEELYNINDGGCSELISLNAFPQELPNGAYRLTMGPEYGLEIRFLISDALKAPEGFEFSLVFDTYGQSSYDSRTGKLVKQKSAADADSLTTVWNMTEEERDAAYTYISLLNLPDYPEQYNPSPDQMSCPSQTVVLTVSSPPDYGTRVISCIDISFNPTPVDDKGNRFVRVTDALRKMIYACDAWKALPDYEIYYD